MKHGNAALRGAGDYIEVRVPSRAKYLSLIRAIVADLAANISMPQCAVEDLQVAISEACANVVRHAYPSGDPRVAELLVRCSTDGRKITAEVIDRGTGFDIAAGRRDPDSDGGLGLILIRKLMDQVQVDSSPDRGTAIRMVKGARVSSRAIQSP